jgi:hypothetical protein
MADTDWTPENCSVVAFLYDPINNDVLQVETATVVGDLGMDSKLEHIKIFP